MQGDPSHADSSVSPVISWFGFFRVVNQCERDLMILGARENTCRKFCNEQ